MALNKIVLYLLPIVALVLLAIFYPGTFAKLKDTVMGVKEYVQTGVEKEEGAKVIIPDAHRKAIERLLQTMKNMRNSKAKECFANYYGLPALGEKGTSISFEYNPKDDSTKVIVRGGRDGLQVATDLVEEIEGIRPCVIAGQYKGEQTIANNFYYTVLAKDKAIFAQLVKGGLYSFRENVVIKFENPTVAPKGNVIRVEDEMVDKHPDNLDDGGWLFTPDNKHICFFPTVKGRDKCENDEQGGLDDDCLGQADPENTDSIPHQISFGRAIKYCPSYDEQIRYKWIELAAQGEDKPDAVDPQDIANKCILGVPECHTFGGGCDDLKGKSVGKDGCAIIATDIDRGVDSFDCADGEAVPGSKIMFNPPYFISSYDIIQKTVQGKPDARNILSKDFKWESFGEEVICAADKFWYPCTINNFIYRSIVDVRKEGETEPKYMRCTGGGWRAFIDPDNDKVENGDDLKESYLGRCVSSNNGRCFDNCPEMFNLDQEDVDKDGVGDACDVCPTEAVVFPSAGDRSSEKYWFGYKGCSLPSVSAQVPEKAFPQNDQDDDGIIDSQDNCPPSACIGWSRVDIGSVLTKLTAKDCANSDQKDENNNRKGDICDHDFVTWVKSS